MSGKLSLGNVEFALKNEIDVSKYIDHVRSIFDQIFDPMGLDFDEIRGVTKLERWI